MRLGVIADDFTGGLDAAGFIRNNGMETMLFSGIPSVDKLKALPDDGACVIALQIRSIDPDEASRQAVDAARALREAGCGTFYFKYCSTFDSTDKGNIGPIMGALMKELGISSTIAVPSLPVNGRTVKDGILYVKGVPLGESPMRYHPLNPMKDSFLPDILRRQSSFPVSLITQDDLRSGKAGDIFSRTEGCAIVDAVDDGDVLIIAETFRDLRLMTGGSALTGMLARVFSGGKGFRSSEAAGTGRRRIIFSGSCSAASNEQVAEYRKTGALMIPVSVEKCLAGLDAYADELVREAGGSSCDYPPMIYSTKSPDEVKAQDARYPDVDIAALTESLFAALTRKFIAAGYDRFIVGGGETSGSVVRAAGLSAFSIGREIAPGVSWMYSDGIGFALKSGNFGGRSFFSDALQE